MKKNLFLLITFLSIISFINTSLAKELVIKSEEQLSFARMYMKQGEFEKAIVELERYRFFFPDDENIALSQYLTGECYLNLKKYSKAREILEELYKKEPNGKYGDKALFLIGESFYKEGKYHEAEICFTGLVREYPSSVIKDKAIYRLGWSQLSDDRWGEASQTFKSVNKDSLLYTPSLNISEKLINTSDYKEKDPLTAGIMAGIVPGLGHAYCNRYRDGATAFILNGLFIWAAVESFESDNDALGGILSFLEAGWYAGNIYSAVNCAHKYNRKSKRDFILKLHENVGLNLFSDRPDQVALSLNFRFQ